MARNGLGHSWFIPKEYSLKAGISGMDWEWTRNGLGMTVGKFTKFSSFQKFQE